MVTPEKLKRLAAVPVIGRALLLPYRFMTAVPYAARPLGSFLRWLMTSNETTNYTYHLTPLNQQYLAAFVAEVADTNYAVALAYMNELQQDEQLRTHLVTGIQSALDNRFADADIRYARRLGWYAIVRALKPKIVVETGVDKGLGACVLTAALARNAQEGSPGRYYGTEINPKKGYLLSGHYSRFGTILYGDSIESLLSLDCTIDVFINDSDHSADYERREYQAVDARLSPNAVILGDNADVTDELLRYAERTGRRFLFFREEPENHWYAGGVGAAYRRRA